ncbi:MAG: NUDIX hydrolase [Chloroflexota bacterium]
MAERTVASRTVFEGRLLTLRVDEVALDNGRTASREIVQHPGAVGIVALTVGDELVLVRQYRKAAEMLTLEIPAGTLGKGEPPADCARRELAEETGYAAGQLQPICSFYTAVGFCTELMHLFLARELLAGSAANEEDEDIEVLPMPVAQALAMVERGQIVDAKTVAAVLWAQLFLAGQRPFMAAQPAA